MHDLSSSLPFSRAAMIAALAHLASRDTLDELAFRQAKLDKHLKEKPLVEQSSEISSIMQRSIRLAEDLAQTGIMIPYLVAGSSCRILVFKGHSDPARTKLPTLGTRLLNFSMSEIGKSTGTSRINYNTDSDMARHDSWIRITTGRNQIGYTAIGPSKSLIENNLISQSIHSRYNNGSLYSTVHLLLPIRGDNLTWHRAPRELVEAYLADLPYDRVLAVWENEQNANIIKDLQSAIDATKMNISRDTETNEDFREIIEIANPMRPYSSHEWTRIRSAMRRGLTCVPNEYAKPISDILSCLRHIPDENDRAIAWIGISNGTWRIPA